MKVIITTYNRPKFLTRLLKQLKQYDVSISVYNDGSDKVYTIPDDIYYHKFKVNHGKKYYWKVFNHIFQDIKKEEKHDHYLIIPDDVILSDHFFHTILSTWHSIRDAKKICLNPLADNRTGPQWTGFKRVKKGIVYQTQWNDLAIFCTDRFFRALDYKIDPIDPGKFVKGKLISSGVGHQISVKLYKKFNLYQCKQTLLHHGKHKSVMHPERKYFITDAS